MNVLIIFAHPSKKSYTAQVLEQLTQSFVERNFKIELSDLYAMNFQSDMSEAEYFRETSGQVEHPIPADVQAEHLKIEKADCIIFLYPVWWSDCPAKMKGWFDRVLTTGYAYKQREGYTQMKKVTHGIALCTAGYSNEYLLETGMA